MQTILPEWQVKVLVHSKMGKQEGEWNYYYDNGKVRGVSHFHEDKIEGEWKFLSRKMEIFKRLAILRMVRETIGRLKTYDYNGKIITRMVREKVRR